MSLVSTLRSCIASRRGRLSRPIKAWLGAMMVVGLCASACNDDDDDNGTAEGEAQLEFGLTSSTSPDADRFDFEDADGTVYSLTSARLSVDQIELQLPDGVGCDDVEDQLADPVECDEGVPGVEADELIIDGPFVIDLVEGTTTPDLGDIVIPALEYEEVDVEVTEIGDDDDVLDSDDELIDNTIVAVSDFEFENSKRELDMRFGFDGEATGGDDVDFNLERGDTLVVQFDVGLWLRDTPVTSCLEQGDLKAQNGRVILDEDASGACDGVEGQFEDNWEDSIEVVIERANALR
jgi:hypothetical protein